MGAENSTERKKIADGDEMFMELNESINKFINSDLLKKKQKEKNQND